MTHYDVFNGDADGLCSLLQLRLAHPRPSVLVTGAKRDIHLLDRVPAGTGDSLTVLDISLAVEQRVARAPARARRECRVLRSSLRGRGAFPPAPRGAYRSVAGRLHGDAGRSSSRGPASDLGGRGGLRRQPRRRSVRPRVLAAADHGRAGGAQGPGRRPHLQHLRRPRRRCDRATGRAVPPPAPRRRSAALRGRRCRLRRHRRRAPARSRSRAAHAADANVCPAPSCTCCPMRPGPVACAAFSATRSRTANPRLRMP